MLTEIYIEALLVDERMADQVWELWGAGLISDDLATLAWLGWWLITLTIRSAWWRRLSIEFEYHVPLAWLFFLSLYQVKRIL